MTDRLPPDISETDAVESRLPADPDQTWVGQAGQRGRSDDVHAVLLDDELGFATFGRVPEAFPPPAEGYFNLLVMHRRV